MSVPTTGINKPTPDFFDVPAVNTPFTLFKRLQRSGGKEKNAVNQLYPKLRFLKPEDQLRNAKRGQIIIPQEYIVVGGVDDGLNYKPLIPGKQFFLKRPENDSRPGIQPILVNVLKNRCCGPAARTLILLSAVETNGSLEDLADVDGILDVTTDSAGANIVGQLHPGKANASGSGQGYPNAYGHSRPVLPTSFRPLFTSFEPAAPVVSSPEQLPAAVPGPKTHTLRDRLLLKGFQFIAWLLATFGGRKPARTQTSVTPIKVAILDTGLHGGGSKAVAPSDSCSAVPTGWNFVDDTRDVNDDHASLHGTRITAIIQQQAPSAVCLPVKTANKEGVCELYDVLCGLEYARVNGANIVNASFSFSANDGPDGAIPLLHNLISALERANIWVIAAAGNAIQYVHDSTGETPPLGQDAPFLYPACYSRASNRTDANDRLITVTTVSKTQRAGNPPTFGLGECYSPAFVDVGMIANSKLPTASFVDDKSFKAPGFDPEPGTSYATAYMTGRVANALATQTFAGKMQLVTATGPELKPDLATGIRQGRSIPA